ncbi:hypothetical protein AtNW77_Chr1g0037491 [Arabidopsis thaliana]
MQAIQTHTFQELSSVEMELIDKRFEDEGLFGCKENHSVANKEITLCESADVSIKELIKRLNEGPKFWR